MNPDPAGSPAENNQDRKGTWLSLVQADEIGEGKGKSFELPPEHGEKKIAVFLHQGEWFALDDCCTHAEIALAGAPIKDGCLMCPWHYAEFDLKTGAALSGPATEALKTYELRLSEDGTIEVKV